jgi:hypothetical protein
VADGVLIGAATIAAGGGDPEFDGALGATEFVACFEVCVCLLCAGIDLVAGARSAFRRGALGSSWLRTAC